MVLFPKKLTERQVNYIASHSHFYNCLKEQQKRVFEHRVHQFIEEHSFHGNGIEITEKVKTLVATMAVTLTFGLNDYLFSKVKTIIIYPESYYSTILKQYHKGETNPKLHLVVFSWVDFLEGIQSKNDNLNLAIHELSHALHFGFKKDRSFSAAIFRKYFAEILEHLKSASNRNKIVEAKYLRSYGFENKYEFLAVLIEHYFETPHEFEQKLPEIFLLVKKMLNLDILKIYGRKVS